MVKSKNMLLILVLIAAGLIVFVLFFNSDEAVIKKRFRHLAEQFDKAPSENNLVAAAKARRVADMFADSCRVYLPAYDVDHTFSARDVPSYVMMARSRYRQIALDFYDFNFVFPQKDRADVNLTAMATGIDETGAAFREIHEMTFSLEKIEDEWLFTAIEAVQVLEK